MADGTPGPRSGGGLVRDAAVVPIRTRPDRSLLALVADRRPGRGGHRAGSRGRDASRPSLQASAARPGSRRPVLERPGVGHGASASATSTSRTARHGPPGTVGHPRRPPAASRGRLGHPTRPGRAPARRPKSLSPPKADSAGSGGSAAPADRARPATAAGTTSGSRPSASTARSRSSRAPRPPTPATGSTAGAAPGATTCTCSGMPTACSSRSTTRTSGAGSRRA